MRARKWTNDDFRGFIARAGLSATQASEILGVHGATVHRMKSGYVLIKDAVADKATAWLETSRTTRGMDADILDSSATLSGWADLCEQLPLAHVTALTSAIGRGWTSELQNHWRWVGQPVRIKTPEVPGLHLELCPSEDLTWGIESRTDQDGRPYRVASIERTIVELVLNECRLGETSIMEALTGAFSLSEQAPDIRLVYAKVRELSPNADDLLHHYLSRYL